MTDRVASLTVILTEEARVDDVQALVDAIGMMRGVLKVELGPVTDLQTTIAYAQARRELCGKIGEILRETTLRRGNIVYT